MPYVLPKTLCYKKWRRGRPTTQAISGPRVNVADPCASLFCNVAQGFVAFAGNLDLSQAGSVVYNEGESSQSRMP